MQDFGLSMAIEPKWKMLKMPTMEDCVGETPLVRLQRMPTPSSLVLCKLEGPAFGVRAHLMCSRPKYRFKRIRKGWKGYNY